MRFANAPYQREVMEAAFTPGVRRITLKWGAQVGKTQIALAIQAYCIAVRPRSQMVCQPSQGDMATWLETKFTPLVDSSPLLSSLIAKPRSRKGVNNRLLKSVSGRLPHARLVWLAKNDARPLGAADFV